MLSELLRQGYIAALAPTGVPNADIVVTNMEGSRLCSIQVKTRRGIGADGGWHVNAKHEEPLGERHFYCFVDFQEPQKVRSLVYVMPAAVVAKVIAEAHRRWLGIPGNRGQPHKDGPMRRLLPDYVRTWATNNPYPAGWMERYRDAWQVLDLEQSTPEQLSSALPENEDNMRSRNEGRSEAVFHDKVMLVEIDRYAEGKSIYDAALYAWKASIGRTRKLDYVLAVRKGVIVGVFVPTEWLSATPKNFPGFPASDPRRVGFNGYEAPAEIQARYCGRHAPVKKRGDQSPVHYYGGG